MMLMMLMMSNLSASFLIKESTLFDIILLLILTSAQNRNHPNLTILSIRRLRLYTVSLQLAHPRPQLRLTASDKVSWRMVIYFHSLNSLLNPYTDDGRAMDVQLRVVTTTPETSDWSIPVTFFCASEPGAPDAPSVLLAEQEIIQVQWDLPTDNGGSSVLGF